MIRTAARKFNILKGFVKPANFNLYHSQHYLFPMKNFATIPQANQAFNEKDFMMKFLEASQMRNISKDQTEQIIQELRTNIKHVTRPKSVAAILHKIQNINRHMDDQLMEQILSNSIQVFKNNYDFSDNGELIRAVILVCCLQKINKPFFFQEFAKLIYSNVDKISFFNLLTIIESYSYNKWMFKSFSKEDSLKLLKSFSNKLTPAQFIYWPKYCNLLYFLTKNAKYELNQKDFADIEKQIESMIHALYDKILQLLITDKSSKSLDLITLTDTVLSLAPFNNVYSGLADKYSLLKKQYNGLVNNYIPSPNEISSIRYDLKTVISFLKRYYVTPPQDFNPQLGKLINHIFWANYNSRDFKCLENYVYFILFLLKTQNLQVPKDTSLHLFDLIAPEKNLVFLSKTLEIYLLCEKNNKTIFPDKVQELKALEKVIFDLIARLPRENAISGSLVQIFQSMVALDIGDLEKWKTLFQIFSNESNIKKLDYMELIIKLIPAAAIKTKGLYKIYSNISASGSSQNIKTPRVDPELAQLVKQFWSNIEKIVIERFNDIYYDKIPTILFHFVYANLFDTKYKKIFEVARKKIQENLPKYEPKQLSEIAYAYARIQLTIDPILFSISSRVSQEKLFNKMNPIELTNFYWALAHARIWNQSLNEQCEAKLFQLAPKLSLESLTEFCQGLALQNRKLSSQEKSILNTATKDYLKKKGQSLDNLNIQNYFGIFNSFNIMENYDDKELWQSFIEFIKENRGSIESSTLLLNYIYILYLHLLLTETGIQNRSELLPIIQKNYNRITDYLKFSKKQYQSTFEQNVRKIITDNRPEFFGKDSKLCDDNSPFLIFKHPLHNLIMLNNIQAIDSINSQQYKFGAQDLIIPYTVDILLDKNAIEVNGPSHYVQDEAGNIKENGYTALKRKFLQKLGWKYIEIPYTIYSQHEDKKVAVSKCLEKSKQ